MHASLFVCIDVDIASNSREAREYVTQWLYDEGFVQQSTYFSNGVADYFVIGGRWSGILTLYSLPWKDLDEWSEFAKGLRCPCNIRADEILRRKLIKRFPEYKDKLKDFKYFSRSDSMPMGYEDDAMVINPSLWRFVVEPGLEKTDYYDGGCVIDISFSEKKPENFINKKWIVVIDFHY